MTLTTPPGSPDELGGALRQVEQEMEQAEAMLVHLQQRLSHLRRAASGLRGLLGLPDPDEHRHPANSGGDIRRGVPPQAAAKLRALRVRRDALAAEQAEVARAEADAAAAKRSTAGDDKDETAPREPAHEPSESASSGDGDDGTSSTDRVIELLREYSPRSVPRAAVLHEFQRRGWIEESWTKPDAAVRMAIQRALRRGEAEIVDGGRLIHRNASLFADVHVEGGDV